MKDIMTFRRVEKKYRLTPAQKDALLDIIGAHLTPDAHGRNRHRGPPSAPGWA